MGAFTAALKHLLILSIIGLVMAVIYSKVSVTYFCAEDDFIEVHLAAFGDIYNPSQIITTSHLQTQKYRPLNRAINLLTYWLGDGNSEFFRVRNIAFHMLNVVILYWLSYYMFKSIFISSLSSALFGLSPLTNQPVAGAIMTNVIAHTWFLLAVVFFISSLRVKRFWWQLLVISLVFGWASLLTYDSEIMVFVLMFLYFMIYYTAPDMLLIRRRFLFVFATVFTFLIGSYFVLRIIFVPRGWGQTAESLPSLAEILENFGMYTFALLLPVDPILANEWLHVPFPSEIRLNASIIIALTISGFGFIFIAAFALWRWTKSKGLVIQTINLKAILFIGSGIFLPLLPVLLLVSHPSETYLYMSVAFYSLLSSCIMANLFYSARTLRGQSSVIAISLVLLGLFCAATWIRNERVVRCGETAHRILYSLQGEQLTNGTWMLSFANMAGGETSRQYGLYGFRGIDTIGARREGADTAMTSALQFVYKNVLLTGEILKAEKLVAKCSSSSSSHHLCLWVHWDGQLEELWKHTGRGQ